MKLELIWVNRLGTEHNRGTVGEPSGKYDVNGEPILIGDMVIFTYDKELCSTRVLKHWLTGNPQLLGFESQSGDIFDEQKLKITPRDRLTNDSTVWVGLGDNPDRIIVREQKLKNYHHDTVKSKNPHLLPTFASLILTNLEKFTPATPNHDLLLTLFGTSQTGECKYDPDLIDARAYSSRIQVWSPTPGNYLYIIKNGLCPEPLAYIRINEVLPHGRNSHIRRIEKGYYFCSHLNLRVADFIDEIYSPPEFNPAGEELTVNAIDLGIQMILKSSNHV